MGAGFRLSGLAGVVARTARSRHDPVKGSCDTRPGLGRIEAREEDEVVGHDRGPDVTLEVIKATPGAARQAVSAFQT